MNIVFLLLASIPHQPALEYRCDFFEINNIRTEERTVSYFVFWDFEEDWVVVAWKVKPKSHHFEGNSVVWLDGGVLRRVSFGFQLETWTNYDREIENRNVRHPRNRRGLREK